MFFTLWIFENSNLIIDVLHRPKEIPVFPKPCGKEVADTCYGFFSERSIQEAGLKSKLGKKNAE